MFENYEYFLGAVIALIPLTSITHFIPPPSNCLLADICNHTWIPECGEHNDDYRIFLDECDMWEYNCDYRRNFSVTNYSMCFVPSFMTCPPTIPCPACPPCPTLPRMNRIGNVRFGRADLNIPAYYGYYEHHTHHAPGKHAQKSHTNPYGIFFHSYRNMTPTLFTGLKPERTRGWQNPNRRRYSVLEGRMLTSRKSCFTCKQGAISITSSKKTPRKKSRRVTKEIIRTATMQMFRRMEQTAILKVYTVLKKGKMVVKVIKGPIKQTTTVIVNSDYLE